MYYIYINHLFTNIIELQKHTIYINTPVKWLSNPNAGPYNPWAQSLLDISMNVLAGHSACDSLFNEFVVNLNMQKKQFLIIFFFQFQNRN